VNFYKRFIGDIQAKTGALSLAEFGAYDRLLDHYYSTEKAVPAKDVYRICRAMTSGERAAVDTVLAEFFELAEQGYVQSKADEVIAKAQPLIEAARANGKKGGRPPKPKTQPEPSGFQKQNPEETRLVKASQSQSQTHSPSLRSGEVGSDALPGVSPALFADYMAVRRDKRAKTFTATAAKGIIRSAEEAGITVERAVEACCEYGWIGFRADWYAERQASKPRTAPPAQSFAERDRDVGMQRWEEMTGRTHPDRQQPAGVVIEMPANQLAIGGRS
jgi:uncharacterized protein YdaU (DUF1376 family)